MRRAFQLPEDDVFFLDSLELDWEALNEANVKWLIIYDYPLPIGYNVNKTDVALRIESGYPDTQIDMAYYHPALSREDKKQIRQLSNQSLDQKNWQRWSRHRSNPSCWRAGIDCIETHLAYMEHWLKEELKK